MFGGKAGAPRKGRLLASPTNIRLGWKGLPGTNALAYYEKALLTAIKSFITLGPDHLKISIYPSFTLNLLLYPLPPNVRFKARNTKGRKYHYTIDLLFDLFGRSCMTTDNFCFICKTG